MMPKFIVKAYCFHPENREIALLDTNEAENLMKLTVKAIADTIDAWHQHEKEVFWRAVTNDIVAIIIAGAAIGGLFFMDKPYVRHSFQEAPVRIGQEQIQKQPLPVLGKR